MPLPAPVRRIAPDGLRDDVRLRALGVGLGLIPPRTMHSEQDARVLLDAARGARVAVEIGVYEGASALALQRALPADAELHLIDPFGRSADALPAGWGATEWATRRALARGARRRARAAGLLGSAGTRRSPTTSRATGAARSSSCSSTATTPRPGASSTGSTGTRSSRPAATSSSTTRAPTSREVAACPGPTAVVERHLRGAGTPGWAIVAEADRSVAVRRLA